MSRCISLFILPSYHHYLFLIRHPPTNTNNRTRRCKEEHSLNPLNCLFKNTPTKYVINENLEHFYDISFRELFCRIRVLFLMILPGCPITFGNIPWSPTFIFGDIPWSPKFILGVITCTPYIRMLSSDWLMKVVFFYQFLVFFSFSAIVGVFA